MTRVLATAITFLLLAPAAEGRASEAIPAPAVTVVATGCPDGSNMPCADTAERTVYLPAGTSRFSRQHELGHVFDVEYLDDGERARFQTLVDLDGPWVQGTGMSGTHSPAEWFADAYATCRMRLTPGENWEDAYGYDPTRREQRTVCGFILRAARDLA